jgi:hypothetical protein
MGNRPVEGVDPDGRFFVAAAIGAAIGAVTSGAIYSVNAALFGKWEGKAFWRSVGVPSLLSAGIWGANHETRWFGADASRRGANYFDREFGSGANGYVPGGAAFFDRNSFVNGGRSPYINRRTGIPNFADNPIRYRFRWYDPLIQAAGLLPLFLLL